MPRPRSRASAAAAAVAVPIQIAECDRPAGGRGFAPPPNAPVMVLIPFSSASNQCSGIANLRWRGISHLQGHAISCVAWIVHPMSDGIQQMYALRAAALRLAGESACLWCAPTPGFFCCATPAFSIPRCRLWASSMLHCHCFITMAPWWGVPYMWNGSLPGGSAEIHSGPGIVYNRSLNPPPARWADLWIPSLKGRLTMLDDPENMLGACLKKLGLPFSATNPGQLARAEREAIAQKPLLRAYLNAEVRDQLVAGDVLAAQLWSTTAQQAIDAAPHLAFVYPAEGFPLYCDCAVILRESRRARLAHRFLDYLLRPAVSARIVESTRTATANASALELLP